MLQSLSLLKHHWHVPSLLCLMSPPRAIPRETYIAALRCFLNPPFTIGFEQFQLPTHFIAGEHDKLASPAEMNGVARRVPNIRFSVVENAGHLVNLEQPEQFNQLIQQFLREDLL
ncbi:MAG: alpha/beta hydrolase [Chloroflexota bacterium]